MKKSPVLPLFMAMLVASAITWGQDVSSSVELKEGAADPAPGYAQLQAHFHQQVDNGLFAGTVILLKKGNLIHMDKYGMQNIEAGIPMSDNTIFRMASMTKPVTSVATMMLVEAGKIRLDDPVEKFIPAFAKMRVLQEDGTDEPLHRPITVKDLMMHTSGIASTNFQNTLAEKAYREAFKNKRITSLDKLVEALAELPLAHQPGEHWTYGHSTDVLGQVVEIASGEQLDVFFEKNIFQPLKMEDTGFQIPKAKLPRLAAGYGKDLKLLSAPDEDSPLVNGKSYPRGTGGLVSTASDYMRFAQLFIQGGESEGVRLLKAETIEQMIQNQLPEGVLPHTPGMPVICNGFGLGFGVQTDEPIFGSPGDFAWPGAYFTYFFVDPSHGGVGIFLAQSADLSNMKLMGEFHEMASKVFK